jgi:RHS repeat-associated protein
MRLSIFILLTWLGWGGRAWAHVRPPAGGGTSGQSLPLSRYTNNLLNQITSRDFPGTNDLLGTVPAWATVSVNGQTNVYRHGEYFQKAITVNNTTGAVWLALTNQGLSNGAVVQTVTGNLFFPRTAETFQYDADGNLTNDGRWNYTWDAANQLTSMESRAGILPAQKLLFTYDWLGRRISKTVSNNVAGTWQLTTDNRFVYDGWNLIAILDSQSSILASFTWGLDASGTMQGAGGVGGLLSMTIPGGTNAGTYFYCYDGNHNVVGLISASNGAVVAQYEHGPFHELLRATGPLAQTNHFLAATKYLDWETGLYYYGFRYYDPSTGRWLSRDPIGEAGGRNLQGFVLNSPQRHYDVLGLDDDDYEPEMLRGLDVKHDEPYWWWGILIWGKGKEETYPPHPVIQARNRHVWPQVFQPGDTAGELHDYYLDDDGIRGFFKLKRTIADDAEILLELTPQNTISVVVVGESLSGQKCSKAERGVCLGASAGGAVAGRVLYKISGALLKKLNGKKITAAKKLLSTQCSTASKGQPFIMFNKVHIKATPNPRGTGPSGAPLQSHHALQGEWAENNLAAFGYSRDLAPTVTLESASGLPHAIITARQNARWRAREAAGMPLWGTTLQEELRNTLEDFRAAGFDNRTIQDVLEDQYKMLDALGVNYQRLPAF